MIRSRVRAPFVLAVLVLLFPAIAAVGIDPVRAQDATPEAAIEVLPAPLAQVMPAETSAFVATAFDPTSDQYLELSSLAARLIIPGAGDTISALVQQITLLLARVPSDLSTVLEGEIGVGLTGFSGSPGDQSNTLPSDPGAVIGSLLPSYAVVLHPREAGKARELVEDWFTDQVEQSGGLVERSEDGSIVVLRNATVDSAESDAPSTVVFSGDYIFFGADFESLLPFVETSRGNAPSLADSDDLQRLNAALPTERLLFGYLDISVFLQTAGDMEIASVEVSSIDPPFGPTAFSIAADDVGLRLESVSLSSSRDGRLFGGSNENPDFASHVPDSTLAMFASQDLGDSWLIEQLQNVLLTVLVGSMGGGDVELSDFGIDEQFGFLSMLTGINFKTDMFDQLQGDYGVALFSLDLKEPMASSAVVASNLANPNAVSVAVTSLGPLIQSSGAGTASVTTASIDGQTVTNVTVGTNGSAYTIQYGVVDEQLMIGLGDGIETIAVPPVVTLDSSTDYQDVLALLPDTYDSVFYVDTQSIAEQLAPLLLDSLAESSSNAIVRCLAGSIGTGAATPAAVETGDAGGGNLIVDTACSVINGLLGGENRLLELLIARMPGPFAAVTYQEDDLQHVSGVLAVGSSES